MLDNQKTLVICITFKDIMRKIDAASSRMSGAPRPIRIVCAERDSSLARLIKALEMNSVATELSVDGHNRMRTRMSKDFDQWTSMSPLGTPLSGQRFLHHGY